MISKVYQTARWLFWSRVYDVCGAVEYNAPEIVSAASKLRFVAIEGMSRATDWGSATITNKGPL